MDPEFAVDCLLHVALLFAVLSLFFHLFISRTTSEAFRTEFRNLVEQNVERNARVKKAMSTVVARDIARSKNARALHELYAEPDAFVTANNAWLFRACMLVTAGLAASILGITWASGGAVRLGSLLGSNLVTFALVGVVEYLFFVHIVLRFQPAPPSLLITSAMSKAKRMFERV